MSFDQNAEALINPPGVRFEYTTEQGERRVCGISEAALEIIGGDSAVRAGSHRLEIYEHHWELIHGIADRVIDSGRRMIVASDVG